MLRVLRNNAVLSTIWLVVLIAVVAACQKAPITGRNQIILISAAEEIEMGLLTFKEIIKNEKISDSPEYNGAMDRVVFRIAKVSHQPDFDWEYKVIDNDETINAFALPGGKVVVYTGILEIAESDSGLATVIGHEVAHATAHHGAERISAGILAQLGAVGLNLALLDSDPKVLAAVNAAYGVGVTVGAILPFSRTQEAEADRIGLIYMAKAGYHPSEAIGFWDRMHEATKGEPKPPDFLSTHPGYKTRRANLKKWQPEALWHYNKAQKAPNKTFYSNREMGLEDFMLSEVTH